MRKTVLTVLFIWGFAIFAKEYRYSDLVTKDYDEMNAEVNTRLKKARQVTVKSQKDDDTETGDREAVIILRDTMQLVFSRPDQDSMVSKLVPSIRKELVNYGAFEDTVAAIATQAISSLKSSNAPTYAKSTAIFVLENLMAEIRPEVESRPEFKKIIEEIRDAKIKVSDKVISDRKLTGMFKTASPSETANKLLKDIETKQKNEKKKESKKSKQVLEEETE